jgi:cystathionine beta-synthase
MTDPVGNFVGAPLGLIGIHESIGAARTALASSDALLVTEDGKPIAVVTRHDLLAFLSE